MNKINYIKLYKYYKEEEGLSKAESLRNIWRTRNLPKKFKELVAAIIEGKISTIRDFHIDGISIRSLHNDEDMTWMQSVFFLEWLNREPANARAFMSSRRFRDTLVIDNETKEDIKSTLERLNSKRKEKLQPIMVPQDKSEEDIDINHEGSLVGVMTADALQTIKEKQIESEEDSKRNDIDENR